MKAIIEMPAGTRYKFEVIDPPTDPYDDRSYSLHMKIDRILAVPVPQNYGFVPYTIAEDKDPKDIFVIGTGEGIPSGTLVDVTPVGTFKCTDQGIQDDKIVAIVTGLYTPDQLRYYTVPMLVRVAVEDLQKYLETYKEGFVVQDYIPWAE
jgi:inorganic pyrophosphatase